MSSPQSFHGSRLQSVMHSLTCCLSGNVPLLHTSTQRPGTSLHVISFTKPSPVLVLQATNTGVRRSGYKARHPLHYLFVPSINDDDQRCVHQRPNGTPYIGLLITHCHLIAGLDLVTVTTDSKTSVLISSVYRCLKGWTRYAYQGHGTGTGTTQGEVVVVKCIYLSSGLH